MEHLRIQHHTTYLYNKAVEFGRHRLVLRPREGHDVRVERMRLRIEPAHRLMWARDVFGNSVAIVDFTESGMQLDIRSDVTIRRSNPFPQQEPHAPCLIPYPVVYDALETTMATVAPRTAATMLDTTSCGSVAARLRIGRGPVRRGRAGSGPLAGLC